MIIVEKKIFATNTKVCFVKPCDDILENKTDTIIGKTFVNVFDWYSFTGHTNSTVS